MNGQDSSAGRREEFPKRQGTGSLRDERLMEAAMGEAFLVPRLDEIGSVEVFLADRARKAADLIPCRATAFWLVDDLDFRLAYCSDEKERERITAETEELIEDGTVAWALGRGKAIIVRTRLQEEEYLLLHGLRSSESPQGLFVALLAERPEDLTDLGRAFLTVTLTLAASTLHNLRLYRLVSDLNDELKLKVDHLEATEGERAAYQRRLERLLSEKTEESRAKNLFIANVSHEMRTPLNGVLGMAELLADSSLAEEDREKVETIRGEAQSLRRLINDVLDFSKLEAAKMELEKGPFRLRELLGEIESSLSPRAVRKGLAFRIHTSADVPEGLVGDRGRLRQVLVNLADNAIKFTDEGEVLISLSRKGSDEKTVTVRFAVRDTGVGISEAQRSRLFQDFSQGDATTTRRYGGTGLGLAISKRIVDLMGGTIGVESAPGEGSLFFFDLPFGLTDDERSRPKASSSIRPSLFPGAKVLIVDDSPTNRRVADALVRKLGLTGTTAASAEEALGLLEEEPFDLILMDIQMPAMDGLEATGLIRRSEAPYRDIPIIAVTAGAFEGDRKGCLEAGMDDYLAKPILPEALRRVIDEVLERRLGREASAPPVDLDLLCSRMGGDRDFCLEIVATFVLDLEERLDETREAFGAGDGQRLSQAAHRLRGAAANSAALALEKVTRDLEQAITASDWRQAAEAVNALEREGHFLLRWWNSSPLRGGKE
jgi:signal transduction histidine kinase/CheY-like chemotaxis protein/HPt (histidine-containing phosphotransfer) domain-containing protein